MFFLSFVILIVAQPIITFENLNHNFGDIKEEKGIVEHSFTFTNTGDDTLQITKVKAS
jgi:hypothetical protein